MRCGLLFAETRFAYPVTLRSMALDVLNRQFAAQAFYFSVHSADGPVQVTLDGVAESTQRFTTDDLRGDTGEIPAANWTGRAMAYALEFQPVGGGYLEVGPVRVTEMAHERERTRGV
jgi:hypothetical protein